MFAETSASRLTSSAQSLFSFTLIYFQTPFHFISLLQYCSTLFHSGVKTTNTCHCDKCRQIYRSVYVSALQRDDIQGQFNDDDLLSLPSF